MYKKIAIIIYLQTIMLCGASYKLYKYQKYPEIYVRALDPANAFKAFLVYELDLYVVKLKKEWDLFGRLSDVSQELLQETQHVVTDLNPKNINEQGYHYDEGIFLQDEKHAYFRGSASQGIYMISKAMHMPNFPAQLKPILECFMIQSNSFMKQNEFFSFLVYIINKDGLVIQNSHMRVRCDPKFLMFKTESSRNKDKAFAHYSADELEKAMELPWALGC